MEAVCTHTSTCAIFSYFIPLKVNLPFLFPFACRNASACVLVRTNTDVLVFSGWKQWAERLPPPLSRDPCTWEHTLSVIQFIFSFTLSLTLVLLPHCHLSSSSWPAFLELLLESNLEKLTWELTTPEMYWQLQQQNSNTWHCLCTSTGKQFGGSKAPIWNEGVARFLPSTVGRL